MERNNTLPKVGTRIIIVDHQQSFVQYIQQLIEYEPHFEFTLAIDNGIQLLQYLQSSDTDSHLIIIGTIKGSSEIDNISYAKYINRYFPKIKLILISYHHLGIYIQEMYQVGILGYLFRNFNQQELIACLQAVAKGQQYYEGDVKACMNAHQHYVDVPSDDEFYLTPMEKNLLQWLEQGLAYSEIEKVLNIRKSSIDAHWKNITRKLGQEDLKTIIQLATEKGLLEKK